MLSSFQARVIRNLLPAALLISALGSIFYMFESLNDEKRLIENESDHVRAATLNIDRTLLSISRDARYTSSMLLGIASRQTDIEAIAETTEELKTYLNIKEIYSKLRWIDEAGQERIRIENDKHGAVSLPFTKTEKKADRYYFSETMKLGKEGIYLSPLDLEVDHNLIRQPYFAVLRAAVPLYDTTGKPRGIGILTYDAQDLFRRIETVVASANTEWMLLNQEGYWLHSPHTEHEFGFMLPHRANMAILHPQAWADISTQASGSLKDSSGALWLFATIHPYQAIRTNSSPRSNNSATNIGTWKIVKHINAAALSATHEKLRLEVSIACAMMLLLALFISIRLSRSQLDREQHHADLQHALSDIGQQKLALERHEQRLEEAQHLGKIGHWELDLITQRLIWSAETYRIFEIDPQHFDASYDEFLTLVHPEDRELLKRSYREAVANHSSYDIEHRLLFPDGRIKWVNERGITHYDHVGKPLLSVGTVQDISEHKIAEKEIHRLAFYDPLTQLPNRRLLLDRLEQALSLSRRNGKHGALLFLDMDNFKILNDTKGHNTGDLMLIEVASRLKSCTRDCDTVSRIGGDEFVVLLLDLGNGEMFAANQAEVIAEKIVAALNHPYLLDSYKHHSSASIGACLFHGADTSAEDLLKRADTAMYQAKSAGRNSVRFFESAMQAAIEARAIMEAELRHAIDKKELQLYYQMQVDNDQHIKGAEVLLRWFNPERGFVSPAQFIPLAEESGLILSIGHWVLEGALQQLKEWANNAHTSRLQLAVNVSAVQFSQLSFVEQIAQLLQQFAIDPTLLKLELTESMVLLNVEDAIRKMQALKQLGVQFSMDDFGTGYSSLSYLKRLPLNQIKIDQSFIRDIATDPSDAILIKTIIDMSNNFGLDVIAEGVETAEQLVILRNSGCRSFQGYYFGKPVPLKEFEQLVKQIV